MPVHGHGVADHSANIVPSSLSFCEGERSEIESVSALHMFGKGVFTKTWQDMHFV